MNPADLANVTVPQSAVEILRAMAVGLPLKSTNSSWAIVNPPGHELYAVDCQDVAVLQSLKLVRLDGTVAELTDCGRRFLADRNSELLSISLEWLKSMPDSLL